MRLDEEEGDGEAGIEVKKSVHVVWGGTNGVIKVQNDVWKSKRLDAGQLEGKGRL